MNKFNLPMLGIGVLVALTATVLTNMENSGTQVFETQSVRTTRSLGLQNQNSGKEYCKITFNPKSPTVNEPFTVTVDGIINNGMTIETFIQGPNSGGGGTNNFSGFPMIITETKETAGKYVYTFTIKGDNSIKCEGVLTIGKGPMYDPVGPGPIIDNNPNTIPVDNNTVGAIDVDAKNPVQNPVQTRSLRQ